WEAGVRRAPSDIPSPSLKCGVGIDNIRFGVIAASPLNGHPIQALLAFSWSEHMNGFLDLAIFLTSTFVSALIAGLSGFAFGLVAASLWLFILSPLQTA